MKNYIWLFSISLLTNILLSSTLAANISQEYEKVIYIDQLKQVGAAYENGKKVMDFPVLTGDDETTTDPGIYLVRVKDEDYYSRKYQTPMPYSIFFNYTTRTAIHGGEVPPPKNKIGLATHGCVHVEEPYIKKLYDWTEAGRTLWLSWAGERRIKDRFRFSISA
jgi:lipoprotein-anchoring transpeptidase ErfK/SrfK